MIVRFAILFMFSFSQIYGYAQFTNWLPVGDITTGVQVKMPNSPTYENRDVLDGQTLVSKDIFFTNYNNIKLYFESQPLYSADKKAIQNAIQQIALQNQGSPGKKQGLKKFGQQYYYVETPLATGELIRAVLFTYQSRLFHIYVKGSIAEVYDDEANQYINSWELPTVFEEIIKPTDKKIYPKKIETEKQIVKQDNWIGVPLQNDVIAYFPAKPFQKTTFIERGRSDIIITALSYNSIQERLSYVVTKRIYQSDEGQLENEALYDFFIDRIKKKKKLKRLKEIESFEGKQYTLRKGIHLYRLKLFRSNDSMYQFLVKGKRKSVFSEQCEYFFNSNNAK